MFALVVEGVERQVGNGDKKGIIKQIKTGEGSGTKLSNSAT